MYIALLGRQPELSIAELERLFTTVEWFSPSSALIKTSDNTAIDIQKLGGSQKLGTVALTLPTTNWRSISQAIVRHYSDTWSNEQGKITVGISVYDDIVSPREVQKVGLTLKAALKKAGVTVRLVPNQEQALSTATSHHNKLGLSPNKVELLVIIGQQQTIVAESTGAQNITALAARDQGRPRRDAFVGMLPPKLAQIMINLAVGSQQRHLRILDPFCGTGVVLQEAALLGHRVYGTDLSEKMIQYSTENLAWLQSTRRDIINSSLHAGDAMTTKWQQPIDAVVSEVYLGQPFSAPPSPAKLQEVRGTCTHITSSFLMNLSSQLKSGAALAIAVPAWRDKEGNFSHLSLESTLQKASLERISLKTVDASRLMYFRPEQVVARELLILVKR